MNVKEVDSSPIVTDLEKHQVRNENIESTTVGQIETEAKESSSANETEKVTENVETEIKALDIESPVLEQKQHSEANLEPISSDQASTSKDKILENDQNSSSVSQQPDQSNEFKHKIDQETPIRVEDGENSENNTLEVKSEPFEILEVSENSGTSNENTIFAEQLSAPVENDPKIAASQETLNGPSV